MKRRRALALTVLLPLAGLLLVAVVVGKAATQRELPPTGSVAAPNPPLKPALPPWKRLTEKDMEESLEEGDGTEDILRALRSQLDTYAQGKQTPLPAPSPVPSAVFQNPSLFRSLPDAAPAAPREPTIQEVQRAAIRYAEVRPEKISRWRTLSQLRNFIPRLTLGLDRDRNRTIASSTSAGKTTFTVGPEDESLSLDFGFTWDLTNLLWDPAQTSIDVRSRLMVQLRRDVLEEVTRLYFERRRLLAEFDAHPTDDLVLQRERSLRIEELTAQLDALTDGLYSSLQ